MVSKSFRRSTTRALQTARTFAAKFQHEPNLKQFQKTASRVGFAKQRENCNRIFFSREILSTRRVANDHSF